MNSSIEKKMANKIAEKLSSICFILATAVTAVILLSSWSSEKISENLTVNYPLLLERSSSATMHFSAATPCGDVTTTSQTATCDNSQDGEIIINGADVWQQQLPYIFLQSVTGNVIDSGTLTGPSFSFQYPNLNPGNYQFQLGYSSGVPCRTRVYEYINILPPYSGDDICLTTVDTATGYNRIDWEKTLGERTHYYKIYKESNVTSNWDSIGAVMVDELTSFIDYSSSPDQNSDAYHVAVVDSCGQEATDITSHRTIHLTANQGVNGEVNLSWNPYQGFVYPNFEIYRSNDGNPFQLIGMVSNSSFTYSDLTPPIGPNSYTVGVQNPSGCTPSRSSNTSFSNIINENGEAVNDVGYVSKPEINIYPNPGIGKFIIDGQGSYYLEIFNSEGRIVMQTTAVLPYQLDINRESPGIFFIKVSDENRNFSITKVSKN